jgi:hypothetical protein
MRCNVDRGIAPFNARLVCVTGILYTLFSSYTNLVYAPTYKRTETTPTFFLALFFSIFALVRSKSTCLDAECHN